MKIFKIDGQTPTLKIFKIDGQTPTYIILKVPARNSLAQALFRIGDDSYPKQKEGLGVAVDLKKRGRGLAVDLLPKFLHETHSHRNSLAQALFRIGDDSCPKQKEGLGVAVDLKKELPPWPSIFGAHREQGSSRRS